jgi:preprotein translocase subunit SecG
MMTLFIVLHVLVGIALIVLVLLQHGKGADAGAAFGSGASGTVFGARGAAGFLTKLTGWLVASFFATSLAMAYTLNTSTQRASVVESHSPADAGGAAPAAPADSKPADVPPAQ